MLKWLLDLYSFKYIPGQYKTILLVYGTEIDCQIFVVPDNYDTGGSQLFCGKDKS